jgi:hypothetical protein
MAIVVCYGTFRLVAYESEVPASFEVVASFACVMAAVSLPVGSAATLSEGSAGSSAVRPLMRTASAFLS